jgi:PKD repeat protein
MQKSFSFRFRGIILFSLFSIAAAAQSSNHWRELWLTPGSNFYTIQQSFDSAWANEEADLIAARRNHQQRSEDEKTDGTFFQYKRWEYFTEPRVAPSGDLSLLSQTYPNFMSYLQSNPAAMAQYNQSVARAQSPGTWSFVGPIGAPQNGGAGRLNCVKVDPTNPAIIYVGAPCGGLWKTTDGGLTWTCLTDFLPAIGCSDVLIDPTNTNIIYMASGDRDAGDSPSIGVMKSTDGGLTWNTTGLSFSAYPARRISRLLMDPTNPNIIYAGTSLGIYKTYDGGVNWYLLSSLNTMDMEMKPGDPNTLYAGKISFYKSTNGGLTWTQIASGLPQSSQINRIAIAVTPADPNYVYLVASENGSSASEGVYLSTNSGTSFTSQSGDPNLLGWDPNGDDSDGQGWYDLAIAASPFDRDVVIVGGVNVWRSNDAGVNFSLEAHWYGGGGAPYVHADIHDIVFDANTSGKYYIACDGGIFITTNNGSSFTDFSANMGIAQIYRMGLSASNATMLITGHQDNGTNLKNGSNYEEVLGGDGMDCFIDRTNNNNMFGELYYGDFNRSTNGGNSWQGITNGLTGSADWVTPWIQDPQNATTLYAGYDQLFRSTNLGSNWAPTGTQVTGVMKDIAIAPTNNQRIYITNGSALFRSSDGGANWTTITPLQIGGYSITRIAVSPYDPNKIWISVSGYSSTTKVFQTNDAGVTWSNLSAGLPNLPVNCVVAIPGTSSDAIYVGCDAGVYYRDNTTATWQPYFTGLPNTPVFDLEIYQPTMMLRAATYGRGVWEVAVDTDLLLPMALFSANDQSVCTGETVLFTDLSQGNVTAWQWNFPGGNPSSSTQQNPSVTYNTPGTYPVTLSVTNANGTASYSQTAYIYVGGATQPPYVEGFVNTSFVPQGWTNINNGNANAYWRRNPTVGHNTTASAYFDNFNYTLNGEQDEMQSMSFNFTGYTSLNLNFDVAYARYSSSRSDSLEVLVSTDCGQTWSRIFVKGGSTLATAGTQTSAFTPTSSQWRTETVNLNAYAGMNNVVFAFRNRGRHGNFLWLDDINISGSVNAAPVAAISMPTTVCVNGTTQFTDASAPTANSWIWYFPGATPATATTQNPTAVWPAAGTYTVSLVATNSFGSDSTSMVVIVNNAPTANAGADTSYCQGTYALLQASGGNFYHWQPSTVLTNPNSASTGIMFVTSTVAYTVTVTDLNGCSSTDTVTITNNATPSVAATAAPANICVGDTSIITLSNNTWVYAWSPMTSLIVFASDSVGAFPTSSTTYTITATDTVSGCSKSTTELVTVYPPLLTPTVIVNGWTLTCSTFGNTYQWYFNGSPIAGATSQSYVATQVGNYSVEAFTNQGCSSGESGISFVNGIAEQNDLYFGISPNPSNGEFVLDFTAPSQNDYLISIYAMDGKLVYEENLRRFNGAYRKQIDLRNFGSGTYAVRLSDEKGQTVRLVVVQ